MFWIKLIQASQRFQSTKSSTHWFTQMISVISVTYMLILQYIHSIYVQYQYNELPSLVAIFIVFMITMAIYFTTSYHCRYKLKSGVLEWFSFNLMSIVIQILPAYYFLRYIKYVKSQFASATSIVIFTLLFLIILYFMAVLMTKISPAQIDETKPFMAINAQRLQLYLFNLYVIMFLDLLEVNKIFYLIITIIIIPHCQLFIDNKSSYFSTFLFTFALTLTCFQNKLIRHIEIPVIISFAVAILNFFIQTIHVSNINEKYSIQYLFMNFMQSGYIGNIQITNLHESLLSKIQIIFEKMNHSYVHNISNSNERTLFINQQILQNHIIRNQNIGLQLIEIMIKISNFRLFKLMSCRSKRKSFTQINKQNKLYKILLQNTKEIQMFISTNEIIDHIYQKYVNDSINNVELFYLRLLMNQYFCIIQTVTDISLGLQMSLIKSKHVMQCQKQFSLKTEINQDIQNLKQKQHYKQISRSEFKQQLQEINKKLKQIDKQFNDEVLIKQKECILQYYPNITEKQQTQKVLSVIEAYESLKQQFRNSNLYNISFWIYNLKVEQLVIESYELEQFITFQAQNTQSFWPSFYFMLKLSKIKQKEYLIKYIKQQYSNDTSSNIHLKILAQLQMSTIVQQFIFPCMPMSISFNTKNNQVQLNNYADNQLIYVPQTLSSNEKTFLIAQNEQNYCFRQSENMEINQQNFQLNKFSSLKNQVVELENISNASANTKNNMKIENKYLNITNFEQFVRVFNTIDKIQNNMYQMTDKEDTQVDLNQQTKLVTKNIIGVGIENLHVYNQIFLKDLIDNTLYQPYQEQSITVQNIYSRHYEEFSILVLGFWNFQQFMNYNEPFFKIELFALDQIYSKFILFKKEFQSRSKKQLDYDVLCAYYAFLHYFGNDSQKLKELKYKIHKLGKFVVSEKAKSNNYMLSTHSITSQSFLSENLSNQYQDSLIDGKLSKFSGLNRSSQGNSNEDNQDELYEKLQEEMKIRQKVYSNNFVNFLKHKNTKNRQLLVASKVFYMAIICSIVFIIFTIHILLLNDKITQKEQYQQKVHHSKTLITTLTNRLSNKPASYYEAKQIVNKLIIDNAKQDSKLTTYFAMYNIPQQINVLQIDQIQQNINSKKSFGINPSQVDDLTMGMVLDELDNKLSNDQEDSASNYNNFLDQNDLDIIRNSLNDLKLHAQAQKAQIQYMDNKIVNYVIMIMVIALIYMEVRELNTAISKAKNILNSLKFSVQNDLVNTLNYYKLVCKNWLKVVSKQGQSLFISQNPDSSYKVSGAQSHDAQHQLSRDNNSICNSDQDFNEDGEKNYKFILLDNDSKQLSKLQLLYVNKSNLFGFFLSKQLQLEALQYKLQLIKPLQNKEQENILLQKIQVIKKPFDVNVFITINVIFFFVLYYTYLLTNQNYQLLNNFHKSNNMRLQQHVSQLDYLSRFGDFINKNYQMIEKGNNSMIDQVQQTFVQNNFLSEAKDIFIQYQFPTNDTIQTNILSLFFENGKKFFKSTFNSILSPLGYRNIDLSAQNYNKKQHIELINAIADINHFLTISRYLYLKSVNSQPQFKYEYNVLHDKINKLEIQQFSNLTMDAQCKPFLSQNLYTNRNDDANTINKLEKANCILFSKNMINSAQIILNFVKELKYNNEEIMNQQYNMINMKNEEKFSSMLDLKNVILTQTVINTIVNLIIVMIIVYIFHIINFGINQNHNFKKCANIISEALMILTGLVITIIVLYKNILSIKFIDMITDNIQKQKSIYESKLQEIQFDYYLNAQLLKNDQFQGAQIYNYVSSILPILSTLKTVLIAQNYKEILPINQYAAPYEVTKENYFSMTNFLGNASIYDNLYAVQMQQQLVTTYKSMNTITIGYINNTIDGFLMLLYFILTFHLAIELLMYNQWGKQLKNKSDQKIYSSVNILRQIQCLGKDILSGSEQRSQINLNKQFNNKTIEFRLYLQYIPLLIALLFQLVMYFLTQDTNHVYNLIVKPTHQQLQPFSEKLKYHSKKLDILRANIAACKKNLTCASQYRSDVEIQFRYLSENFKVLKLLYARIYNTEQGQYKYGDFINYLSNYQMYNSLTYHGSVGQMLYTTTQQFWNESLIRTNNIEGNLSYLNLKFGNMSINLNGTQTVITQSVFENTFDTALLNAESCYVNIIDILLVENDCKNYQYDLQLIYLIFEQINTQIEAYTFTFVPQIIACIFFAVLMFISILMQQMYGIKRFLSTRLQLFENMAIRSNK